MLFFNVLLTFGPICFNLAHVLTGLLPAAPRPPLYFSTPLHMLWPFTPQYLLRVELFLKYTPQDNYQLQLNSRSTIVQWERGL